MRIQLVALVSTVVTPALAAAQPTPDVVPRELVVALLDRFEMSPVRMDIVVGRLPKSFPSDVLPREDIRILGGLERGTASSVVAVVAQRPDSAAARVTAHLARAGWRRAEEERHLGGFVPSATARPTIFCRANAALNLSARQRDGGGSLLYLGISYPEEYSPCASRAQRRSMYERDFPSLPTLVSPPDARMLGSSAGGGGRDARDASTRLGTEQRATEVAAHYAAQLQRAGWTMSTPIQGNGIVVYRVLGLDADQRPLTGALIVVEIAEPRQLDVVFRVARGMPER
jgi:hypothetical protein